MYKNINVKMHSRGCIDYDVSEKNDMNDMNANSTWSTWHLS